MMDGLISSKEKKKSNPKIHYFLKIIIFWKEKSIWKILE